MLRNAIILSALLTPTTAISAGAVRCCERSGTCIDVATLEACEDYLSRLETPSTKTVVTSARPECANAAPPVSEDSEAIAIAVDMCSPPTNDASGSPALRCFIRDVISLESGVPVASSEGVWVEWPQFSQRPEASFPNFRDPVVGGVFHVLFDERVPPGELRIFAAQRANGVLQ